ncbi:hypothetical protein [Endozoicomonas sp.]|uniref:hypothetical protein n=1 Tax=Endozoicomonas sp. TaxID=1892382 RepID=UPI0028858E1F|nr:hypothetical protein [Endozoicomonas sp.]
MQAIPGKCQYSPQQHQKQANQSHGPHYTASFTNRNECENPSTPDANPIINMHITKVIDPDTHFNDVGSPTDKMKAEKNNSAQQNSATAEIDIYGFLDQNITDLFQKRISPYWRICYEGLKKYNDDTVLLGHEYHPGPKSIKPIGIAYRGDYRQPETIFTTGFSVKDGSEINDDNFGESLKTLRIRFHNNDGNGLPGESSGVQDTGVSLCKDKCSAAYFPEKITKCFPQFPDNTDNSYVYCCLVTAGIEVNGNNHVWPKQYNSHSTGIRSKTIKSVMTTKIPPEHVICAWASVKTIENDRFTINTETKLSNLKFNINVDTCVQSYLREKSGLKFTDTSTHCSFNGRTGFYTRDGIIGIGQ